MTSPSRPRSRSERISAALGRARLACAVLGLWTSLLLPLTVQAASRPASTLVGVFVVIGSPDVTVEDIPIQDARRLMLGERRFWNSSQPVTTLMPNVGSPARAFLLEHLFHMSERAYRRHTLELLYRGELDYAPLVMSSSTEAIALVAAGHGAITVVPLESLSGSQVRILRVGGRLPQDPGYPLALTH